MGLILSIDEIHEHMAQLGSLNERTERTLVYAQLAPSVGEFFLLGAYAQLIKGGYFVMSLEEDSIIIIPLGKLSGKINKKSEPIIIPHEELDGIQLKKGMMIYKVLLLSEEHELPLRLSKVTMGMKWHKENLEHTMDELEKLQQKIGDGRK